MKYSNIMVPFDTITAGENPRIITNLALASLRDSIEGVGLLEPITLWEPVKGRIELIRGHRRIMAIGQIKNQNPKRYAELFGKGIPSLMVTGVTAEEVVVMKLDHSEQIGLSDPHELQRSANMLFAINKTEAEVAMQLAGLIDKIAPMKQAARVELEAIHVKIQAAKASNNDAAVTLAERDYREFVSTYRRGFVQNLHNTFRCPEVVMSALYKRATGTAPEGVTVYLPDITTSDVTVLWKAHKADLEIMEAGVPKYNKQRVGPNFTEKWEKLCAKSRAAEADGNKESPAKPKAMSAKDMQAEVREGKYKSELACILVTHHCGDKTAADRLPLLDTAAYHADLLRKYDAGAWSDLVKAAKVIESRLIEADQKAKVEAK